LLANRFAGSVSTLRKTAKPQQVSQTQWCREINCRVPFLHNKTVERLNYLPADWGWWRWRPEELASRWACLQ